MFLNKKRLKFIRLLKKKKNSLSFFFGILYSLDIYIKYILDYL